MTTLTVTPFRFDEKLYQRGKEGGKEWSGLPAIWQGRAPFGTPEVFTSLAEFVQKKYSNPPVLDDKRKAGGMVAGYSPGGRSRTEWADCLMLDADGKKKDPKNKRGTVPWTPEDWKALEEWLKGKAYARVPSYSYTEEAPRYRIILPLSRRIEGKEENTLRDGRHRCWVSPEWNAFINEIYTGLPFLDPVKDWGRLFFGAAIPSEGRREAYTRAIRVQEDGAAVDVDAVLEAAAGRRKEEEEKRREEEEAQALRRAIREGRRCDRVERSELVRVDTNYIEACNRAMTPDVAIDRYLSHIYTGAKDEGKWIRYKYYRATSTPGALYYKDKQLFYSGHNNTDPAADGRAHDTFGLLQIHLNYSYKEMFDFLAREGIIQRLEEVDWLAGDLPDEIKKGEETEAKTEKNLLPYLLSAPDTYQFARRYFGDETDREETEEKLTELLRRASALDSKSVSGVMANAAKFCRHLGENNRIAEHARDIAGRMWIEVITPRRVEKIRAALIKEDLTEEGRRLADESLRTTHPAFSARDVEKIRYFIARVKFDYQKQGQRRVLWFYGAKKGTGKTTAAGVIVAILCGFRFSEWLGETKKGNRTIDIDSRFLREIGREAHVAPHAMFYPATRLDDEMPQNMRDYSEFKKIITADTFSWNPKFKDVVTGKTYPNYLITSNPSPVEFIPEDSERRILAVEWPENPRPLALDPEWIWMQWLGFIQSVTREDGDAALHVFEEIEGSRRTEIEDLKEEIKAWRTEKWLRDLHSSRCNFSEFLFEGLNYGKRVYPIDFKNKVKTALEELCPGVWIRDNSRKEGVKRSVIQVYKLLEAITEANQADGVQRRDVMD
ncbi:MAG: DUF5906 domain-containing protein [Oscillospiraceae bacterium]|nr:DUF5906 domain-containing protein [Oscillospiraceae bacterium]